MKYNNFWFPENDGFDCIIFWLQGLAEEVALHEKQSMKEHVHQTTQQMANIDLYDLDIQKEMQVTPPLSLSSLSLSPCSAYTSLHIILWQTNVPLVCMRNMHCEPAYDVPKYLSIMHPHL